MMNMLIWAGIILLAIAVLLSSSWFGGGYLRTDDPAAIEAQRVQKKQRMRWAFRCMSGSAMLFVVALIWYNIG